jgi:hypothetical protein
MRRLQANGTTIAYAQTAAGPPIVLMHGAEASHVIFATKAIELAGCRTASADDQRACRGACIPEPPDALRVARDAAALIGGRGLGRAHNCATSLARSSHRPHPTCAVAGRVGPSLANADAVPGVRTAIFGYANAIAAPAHAAQASEALHWHAFRQIFRD